MNIKFSSRLKKITALVGPLVFSALPALAAATAPSIVITPTFVSTSFCNAVGWMFFGLVTLCTIMILWGAYLYATAADNPERVKQAGQTLLYAAIGIIIALIAKAFPQSIAGLFKWNIGASGC